MSDDRVNLDGFSPIELAMLRGLDPQFPIPVHLTARLRKGLKQINQERPVKLAPSNAKLLGVRAREVELLEDALSGGFVRRGQIVLLGTGEEA